MSFEDLSLLSASVTIQTVEFMTKCGWIRTINWINWIRTINGEHDSVI